jgi:hypothetical protein
MRSYTSLFALVGLLIFYLLSAQFAQAEFKILNAPDYPPPEAEFGNFELTTQSLPTATATNLLTTTPNSTASEQPPASSPPPKPFPIELLCAAIAIASAIAIVAITGTVLKKKLQ